MEIIAGILLFATIVSSMTYPAMFLVCSLSLISVAAYLSLKSFHASFVLGTPSPEFNFFADERRNSLVKASLWLVCSLGTSGLLLNRWPLF